MFKLWTNACGTRFKPGDTISRGFCKDDFNNHRSAIVNRFSQDAQDAQQISLGIFEGWKGTLVGKGEAALSLPVVAKRSVPFIYRRASFLHRATPKGLPRLRSLTSGQVKEPENH